MESVTAMLVKMRRNSGATMERNSASTATTYSLPINAEARVLLPAHTNGTQIEKGRILGNFFASLPSAASLSTYAVVKPARIRVHVQHGGGGSTNFTRNKRKQRYHARIAGTRTRSLSPSYSKIKTIFPVRIDPEMKCIDEESQQLQVPTNGRIASSIDLSSMENTRHILLPIVYREIRYDDR
ncbi:LexA repressor [Dirofilaria immitis]